MNLQTIFLVIFFLVYGFSQFVPFKYSDVITGVAAIIVGLIYLFG